MSDAEFPSGPWTGFYTYAPSDKHRMDLHLDFSDGCATGDGNDDVGRFLIRGKYDASSRECYWTKTYANSHDVHYRGFREGKGIWGTWEIMTFAHGGFHIWPKGEQEGEEESAAAETTAPADAIGTDQEVGVPALPDDARSSSVVSAVANLELERQRSFAMRTVLRAYWMAALAWAAFTGNAASVTGGPSVEFTNATQAVIRWTTDVSTGTRVFFGESVARMTRRAQGEQGVNHLAVLPALEPGTKWFFSVGTARVPLATNSFVVPEKTIRERTPTSTRGATAPSLKAGAERKAPPTRAA